MPFPLPKPEGVAGLIGMLVGKRPKVVPGKPMPGPSCKAIATYVDAEKKVIYAAATDLAFLASTGAALAMIPPAIVTEAIRSGKPTEALMENAYEVLNVGASLFNELEGGTHVKIDGLRLATDLPREVAVRLMKPTARMDLDVTIPGYPDGKLTILSLA